jgi:hypothetical protein
MQEFVDPNWPGGCAGSERETTSQKNASFQIIRSQEKTALTPEERAAKCGTVEQARNLIENAQKLGNKEVLVAAQRRLFELQGEAYDDPDDPLARAVWEGIYAYESIVLARKHGRNVSAARTRQFVKKHGAYKSLLLWAERTQPSDGFTGLIEAGHPEITAEYFVAFTYSKRFPAAARENARTRLEEAGCKLPPD